MNRFAFACLSILLSTLAFAPMVSAQQIRTDENRSQDVNNQDYAARSTTREATPFDLTTLAYRGYLEDQGIPAYGNLVTALNTGSIRADDIIQAAIDAGRTSSTTGESDSYRVALRQHLLSLRNVGD